MPTYRKECGVKTFLVCIWILNNFEKFHITFWASCPWHEGALLEIFGQRDAWTTMTSWITGNLPSENALEEACKCCIVLKKNLSRVQTVQTHWRLRWKTHCICWLLCSYKSNTSFATGWQGHPAIGSSSSKQSEGVTFEFPAKSTNTDFMISIRMIFLNHVVHDDQWWFFTLIFNFKDIFETNFGFHLVLTSYTSTHLVIPLVDVSPGNARRSRLVSPLWSRTWVERCHPAMRIPKNSVGTYLLVLTIFALYAQIGIYVTIICIYIYVLYEYTNTFTLLWYIYIYTSTLHNDERIA